MDLPSSNSRESMNTKSTQDGKGAEVADEKKPPRPQPNPAEKCPRCDSGNTKFCYYNNYSLSQPRYFCKACRRYWTKGGTLRNVPAGGGCRKNKRSAKRALDNHHHLLVQSHHQMKNANNNVLLNSAFDPNNNHSILSLADRSNFSSPLRYEDSGTCDSLSLAFATMQSNVQVHHQNHLGFEFDPQNSILGHQPVRTSSANSLGFLSNLLEPQTKNLKHSQSMYNYGFENGGDAQCQSQTQPFMLVPNGDLSLGNMTSADGFNQMNQEMNNGYVDGNRISWGLPWRVECSNHNNGVGEVSSLENSKNNNNLDFGSNNYEYNDVYGVEGGGRSESWDNARLAAPPSWPNLINSTALIM